MLPGAVSFAVVSGLVEADRTSQIQIVNTAMTHSRGTAPQLVETPSHHVSSPGEVLVRVCPPSLTAGADIAARERLQPSVAPGMSGGPGAERTVPEVRDGLADI
jgi:hypothetical protein